MIDAQAALGKRKPPQRLAQRLAPGQHAYYWCCDNTQMGACGFWKWDEEPSDKAARDEEQIKVEKFQPF